MQRVAFSGGNGRARVDFQRVKDAAVLLRVAGHAVAGGGKRRAAVHGDLIHGDFGIDQLCAGLGGLFAVGGRVRAWVNGVVAVGAHGRVGIVLFLGQQHNFGAVHRADGRYGIQAAVDVGDFVQCIAHTIQINAAFRLGALACLQFFLRRRAIGRAEHLGHPGRKHRVGCGGQQRQ